MVIRRISIIIFLFFISNFIIAQSNLQFANIGDLKLDSGDTLFDCSVGYRTYGQLNEDKSNIVIYTTYFNGTSESNIRAMGKDKLIDTTKFYVISIDALGNGVSSSPSNSVKQPMNSFPQFTISDMVKSQYIALTEHLMVNHVYCIIGGSMGSMQVYEWLVAYPDFMDKAIPYVPTPYLTSIDKMLWTIAFEVIKIGQEFNVPDKNTAKVLNMLIQLAATTPERFNQSVDVTKFDEYLAKFNGEASKIFPPINWKYQLVSMNNHDITKRFNGNKEETAKAIKAKVLAIIAVTDHILNPAPAIEFSIIANHETLILENNGGHGAIGFEMQRVSDTITNFLK